MFGPDQVENPAPEPETVRAAKTPASMSKLRACFKQKSAPFACLLGASALTPASTLPWPRMGNARRPGKMALTALPLITFAVHS